MNLVLTEGTVTVGKLRAYLEREERFHALVAKQAGTRAIITFRSLGNPMRFGRAAFVESAAALNTTLESPAFEAFMADNPLAGLVTPTRPPLEVYELAAETGRAAMALEAGMPAVLVDWTLGSAAAAGPFESSRRELFELRQKHDRAFVRSSLYRYLGSPGRYLVAHSASGRELSAEWLRTPEVQAFQDAHPLASYGATTASAANVYEIVKVTRPA